MSPNKRLTIGYLAPAIHSASQDQWLGVVDAARQHDVNVICFPGSSLHIPMDFLRQRNILYDFVSAHRVDGIVSWASSISNYADREEMKRFHERFRPLPVVTIGRILEGFPGLLMDSYQGMREAIEHLIVVHGYRRIAFIRGPQEHFYAQERYRAYRDALAAHDIPFEARLVTPHFYWELNMGREAMQLLLDERGVRPQQDFEAVVSANDHMLLGALEVLLARRIDVPGQVAAVGFDDIALGRVHHPPLTSIHSPYYEVGYQSVETVLALLAGQSVPEKIVVPSKLVVRQSCGCVGAAIRQAVIAEIVSSPSPFEIAFVQHRPQILDAMRQALNASAELRVTWAEELLDAFVDAITKGASAGWLQIFERMFYASDINIAPFTDSEHDMADWHNVLSAMQRHMLPCFAETDAPLRHQAENLWRQARVLLGEAARRMQAHHELLAQEWDEHLRSIGAALITTFDLLSLSRILTREFPGLGIPGCYIALYADGFDSETELSGSVHPQLPMYTQARLIMAYSPDLSFSGMEQEPCFPSEQLIPDAYFPCDRRFSLVVEPLYFREHQIGLAIFEIGPRDGNVYEVLRNELSSALQGDLLVQQVQEHAAEIVRQKYVLDTFMETVPDRIYFKDREGRFTSINQAYARWLGVQPSTSILGKTERDFFPETQVQRNAGQEQQIMTTGQAVLDVEEQQIGADGRMGWSLTTRMPLRNEHGEMIGMFGISRDITDLKKTEQTLIQYQNHLEELVEERTAEMTRSNARLHEEILERRRVEDALRVSEQQYRLLAESVMDGMVIVQERKIVFANAAFTVMVKRPLTLLIGSDPAFLWPDQVEEPGAENAAQWQIELLVADGQTIWAEIESTPMMWNNRPGRLLTIHNITQRKLREVQLEQERARLQQENLRFKTMSPDRYRFGPLVGKSPAMQRVYELIVSAAASDVNVLIVGESGTGKELIAHTLHQVSTRKTGAFVPVNCASIPETLFEREFFGHRKGAFTGADRDHPGFFDRTHKGVLFLDEVTELTPGTQAKLLRVLQDGEYTPLGRNTPKQADVWIIAATNKDCREEIAQGRLRKDFFYRIGVIEIDVPPLRERKEDLPLLIEHLLEQYRQRQFDVHGSLPADLPTDQTMLPGALVESLYTYDWPGNIRELQNVLQRYLATRDLSFVLALLDTSPQNRMVAPPPDIAAQLSLPDAVKAFEKQRIADIFALTRGDARKAAEILNIPLRTLYHKLKLYQIEFPG